jgi:hypothetical protein
MAKSGFKAELTSQIPGGTVFRFSHAHASLRRLESPLIEYKTLTFEDNKRNGGMLQRQTCKVTSDSSVYFDHCGAGVCMMVKRF